MRPLQGRYNERLEITDLLTLEKRRLIIDLQYLYRIFYGLIDIDFSDFFMLSQSTSETRGNHCKLFQPALCKNLNCRKYFFTNRVIQTWNLLPDNIVQAPNLAKFTQALHNFDLNKFLYFAV